MCSELKSKYKVKYIYCETKLCDKLTVSRIRMLSQEVVKRRRSIESSLPVLRQEPKTGKTNDSRMLS